MMNINELAEIDAEIWKWKNAKRILKNNMGYFYEWDDNTIYIERKIETIKIETDLCNRCKNTSCHQCIYNDICTDKLRDLEDVLDDYDIINEKLIERIDAIIKRLEKMREKFIKKEKIYSTRKDVIKALEECETHWNMIHTILYASKDKPYELFRSEKNIKIDYFGVMVNYGTSSCPMCRYIESKFSESYRREACRVHCPLFNMCLNEYNKFANGLLNESFISDTIIDNALQVLHTIKRIKNEYKNEDVKLRKLWQCGLG